MVKNPPIKNAARKSLTKEELLRLTVYDRAKLKLTSEEVQLLRAINAEKKLVREARSIRLQQEEIPIVNDLAAAGLKVNSVWDIVNSNTSHDIAAPILIKHLLLPYSDRTREGIARAIGGRAARQFWPILVELYLCAPQGNGHVSPDDTEVLPLGAKDGLAVALAASVDQETLPELIRILSDQSQGDSRLLLLSALRRSRAPTAKLAMKSLANDPYLKNQIAEWKKKEKRN